ncbi:MAG TPA: hemolysin family protein [Alphaproteobacteria bacterium]|nr:hemolysin family protein [Alphaproteobacteria bacterium]
MADRLLDDAAHAGAKPASETAGDEAERDVSPFRILRQWLTGVRRTRNGESGLREALGELIEETDATGAEIDPQERALLANILKLHDLTVADVMVPRADIVAVEHTLSLDELTRVMGTEAHSRMPVYRETLDDVVGMVHIKDVLAWWGRESEFRIAKIMRPVLFIVPSMRVLDLLLKMRATRHHLALVVDEFGGIDGIVTIEDLVEEIVGEIEDEHDVDPRPMIQELPNGTFLVDGRVEIETFEERVGKIPLDDTHEEVDTLGGLVAALAGRVPARGEIIGHPAGYEFEVIDADARRIKRLRVRKAPQLPPAAS